MRYILLAASLALALAGAVAPAHAALPPGISGAWYNPAQSGHGLTVEILDGQRALVFWHVFDPAGAPVHLYIEGVVEDATIAGQAYLGRGMRFGSFDRAEHQLDHWGEVTLAFAHCNAAQLAWAPQGPAGAGYVAGSMPLVRLTAIEGLPCDFNEPQRLPAGSYQAAIERASGSDLPLDVVVDGDGRLWGTLRFGFTPIPRYVGHRTYVLAGTPGELPQAVDLTVRENLALAGGEPLWFGPDRIVLDLDTQADGSLQGTALLQDGFHAVTVAHDPSAADPLRRDFDPDALEGTRFAFTGRSQFFEHPGVVRFLPGRSFCVDTDQEDCALGGSIRAADAGLAMFDIEGQRGDTHYSGKGWVRYQDGQPARLVLVATGTGGSLDGLGFGVVAERAP